MPSKTVDAFRNFKILNNWIPDPNPNPDPNRKIWERKKRKKRTLTTDEPQPGLSYQRELSASLLEMVETIYIWNKTYQDETRAAWARVLEVIVGFGRHRPLWKASTVYERGYCAAEGMLITDLHLLNRRRREYRLEITEAHDTNYYGVNSV